MRPALLGPGPLILVVGPSGAGKDTLIDGARAHLADRADIRFARRLVTRAPGAGEAHGTLTPDAFAAQRATFALHWDAHGLSYALGPEVVAWLAAGDTVVANGSRATLPAARQRFAMLQIVHVTAPPEVLAQRIAARGRETGGDVAARLARTPPLDAPPQFEIENVGTAAEGSAQLAAFIARTADECRAAART
ncbi:phosphonate metabolism protein/1,5-bisphosphokinase (PRPP-forming) PhnN [Aquabacter spiritensis]|uniref:Ribose 1,5-bisphosphate phosphokinase PhnN n=1 Tax=Aquabacter spiritensis TaxID=933073 RepID=A0A4R3LQQ4_9HYPH|nr:phosphonate metabolism protein/1,5-bisphosphokinase (PRPP-forming) PhnN [Aquabacter spiritensis]TCT02591.1 ribose 1,5-bisphosphokinase [Aquabacter spiritensis]